ncbi:hypothetical protein [Piscirickettsia litoralis]|uniref:hypothetical protein n=1 Tax=Piscirickettsia litoralis TaxID=1891921 RepID=UPI001112C8BC|nr:hypothetical protein [Piscirickettsia litoralis]
MRLPKVLKASNGRACVRCKKLDGTTVYAHYTGIRQHSLGKGMAVKCHDCCGADLCSECHAHFDQYRGCDGSEQSRIRLSEEFLYYCLLTSIRNHQEGVIGELSSVKNYH